MGWMLSGLTFYSTASWWDADVDVRNNNSNNSYNDNDNDKTGAQRPPVES